VSGWDYRAIVSSDWNQCLAPCGPFDPIVHCYPELAGDLESIFKGYTGNRISLGDAAVRISKILPASISISQMDSYLDDSFETYKGVPELIEWCAEKNILFMINTTGAVAYFQRVFARGMLPTVPCLSASPLMRYPASDTDPSEIYELSEIEDKGKNTSRAIEAFGLEGKRLLLIGDSGGDGPHFEWGKRSGAYLIGSMTKQSLKSFCSKRDVKIDCFFGKTCGSDDKRRDETERIIDFRDLITHIKGLLSGDIR